MKKILLSTVLVTALFSNSDYDKWLQEQANEYNSYKKSLDEEFSSMLKKDWQNFTGDFDEPVYEKPKPKKLPIVKKEKVIKKEEKKKFEKIVVKEIEKKEPVKKEEKIVVEIKPIDNLKQDELRTNIDFFGTNFQLVHKKNLNIKISSATKSNISSFWNKASKQDIKTLLEQIDIISKKHMLNDWAKFLLVDKFASKIHVNDELNKNLLIWFILTKMNYDIRIGYYDNKIYLLSNINHEVYQVPFFNINNKKYYVLSSKRQTKAIAKMYTYKGVYSKHVKPLSFEMTKAIKLDKLDIKERKLNFVYNNKDIKINTKYSQNLNKFYSTLPQSDYKIYFESQSSNHIKESLLKDLKNEIKGKSELEALNILLRFSQKAFEYKTDQNQFSYEKVMLPEETLFYAYSDCEDRSIMFRYLVENLTNIKVVGIQYSDHMATAVKLSHKISGSSFKYKGETYTISDPTYLNANIGMAMPKYKNENFKIIE